MSVRAEKIASARPLLGETGLRGSSIAAAGAVAVLLLLPLFAGAFLTSLVTSMLITLIAAASLHLIVRTGHLSLGHAGFMGVGAYTATLLLRQAHWPFLPSLLCGMLAPALLALLVGPLVLRLSGKYFVLVTFLLGEILRLAMQDWKSLTGGANGIFDIPFPPGISGPGGFYYFVLVVAIAVVAMIARILSCEIGRAMDATRQSDRLARCSGIPVLRLKVGVFALACALAGLAGVLQGSFVHFIDPGSFSMTQSLNLLVINVIGGMGSLIGVSLGAGFLTILPELLRSYVELQRVIFGIMLIVVMAALPGGLADLGRIIRVHLARRRWS